MSGPRASFGFRDVDAAEKPALVTEVFDQVAFRYDLMNDVLSAGIHRLWKDAAAARINPQPGELIVDCAGGTGDMADRLQRLSRAAAHRRGGEPATVVVADLNFQMIRAGMRRRAAGDVLWAVGDAQRLPLEDASAHAVCIAFGLRNVANIEAALAEARRVLRPGGRFLCLEFSRPPVAALRRAYDAYSFRLIPLLGGIVGRQREAYRYLVESIRRFPDQARLAELMAAARFSRISVTNFSGGVCALHQGWSI